MSSGTFWLGVVPDCSMFHVLAFGSFPDDWSAWYAAAFSLSVNENFEANRSSFSGTSSSSSSSISKIKSAAERLLFRAGLADGLGELGSPAATSFDDFLRVFVCEVVSYRS
jgi:hypothetical protein